MHRIHELIEVPGSQVTWNDHVPDPDNPSQPRQIDVSIRRGDWLTLVECRLHRVRQGVKWIEELIGRRASLLASEVIAVSDAGFTRGALRKAKRFGILLRDLERLTDAEVLAWGRAHKVLLYFYAFDELDITLILDSPEIAASMAQAIVEDFRVSQDVAAVCNAIVDQLDRLRLLPRQILDQPQLFNYDFQRPHFRLAGTSVFKVNATGRVRLVEREIECQAVRRYAAPEANASSGRVLVENFRLGETKLLQHNDAASFLLDVTSLQMSPLSQLRYVRLKGEVETDMASFEILGAERFRISSGRINLTLARRES